MVKYALIAFAGLAAALPLNINLGAYSPALVVGDGEISFGGEQDVSQLMNALEGAAVNAASSPAPSSEAQPAARPPAAGVESAAADPALAQQAQQIAALQGMGKQVVAHPRVQPSKRDLAGFDRALRYAEVGLTKGPDIQLGTGTEGSGVGIIVDNVPTGGVGKAAKRAVEEQPAAAPRRKAKVTTMYVRRGVPAALQGSGNANVDAHDVPIPTPPQQPPVSRRSDTIDAVNLNVDGDAGLTMTFVEMAGDDDDDDAPEEVLFQAAEPGVNAAATAAVAATTATPTPTTLLTVTTPAATAVAV